MSNLISAKLFVVGYQVANDNTELAMPLYSSKRDGYGIRPDGAEIQILGM